jgi:hypothetical protein
MTKLTTCLERGHHARDRHGGTTAGGENVDQVLRHLQHEHQGVKVHQPGKVLRAEAHRKGCSSARW